MNPLPVGHIDRDALRYHGTLPFSYWGSVWKRFFNHLPVDAAYALYDQCVRAGGELPAPPLAFVTNWENKAFRILRQEDDHVIALYRDDGEFHLITAVAATYEKKAAAKDESSAVQAVRPKYPKG